MSPTATQNRIREASMQLFAERGYAGTSIADIAQQVGISKAGLYNYYSSKEELLLELLEHSFRAWQGASLNLLEGSGTCRDRLWEHFTAAVRFALEHPAEVAIIRVAATQIGGELGQRVTTIVEEKKGGYVLALDAFFSQALERGEIRDAEPEDLTRTWRAFLDGLLTQMLFRSSEEPPSAEALERMWNILWRGFAGPQGETP